MVRRTEDLIKRKNNIHTVCTPLLPAQAATLLAAKVEFPPDKVSRWARHRVQGRRTQHLHCNYSRARCLYPWGPLPWTSLLLYARRGCCLEVGWGRRKRWNQATEAKTATPENAKGGGDGEAKKKKIDHSWKRVFDPPHLGMFCPPPQEHFSCWSCRA